MSNRVRIYTKVTPEELARIKEKMAEVDVRNRSAYLRKMALDGIDSTVFFWTPASRICCREGQDP